MTMASSMSLFASVQLNVGKANWSRLTAHPEKSNKNNREVGEWWLFGSWVQGSSYGSQPETQSERNAKDLIVAVSAVYCPSPNRFDLRLYRMSRSLVADTLALLCEHQAIPHRSRGLHCADDTGGGAPSSSWTYQKLPPFKYDSGTYYTDAPVTHNKRGICIVIHSPFAVTLPHFHWSIATGRNTYFTGPSLRKPQERRP